MQFFGCNLGQILHQSGRHIGQPGLLRLCQHATVIIILRQQKRGDADIAVVFSQITFLQRLCRAGCGFHGLSGQQPLIQSRVGGQDRLVAKQDVKQLELRNMATQNHKAHSKGG